MPADLTQPAGGLWAYYEGQFHVLPLNQENREVDHVTWFRDISLPDYGPEFDRVLRGRMTWDRHMEHYVLSFYGDQYLPNPVYQLVLRHFNKDGHHVIEKPIATEWL